MTRRLAFTALALGAVALVPATASANVHAVPFCDRVEASVSGLPAGTPLTLTTTLNGTLADRRAITAPGGASVPLTVTGHATITVSIRARWGESWSAGVVVDCPVPAPHPVPPVTPPAPPAPTPPSVVVTTPVIRVVPPARRVKPPVKRAVRPKPTCAYLRRVGAGPRWYTRYGHYYRCVAPRASRRPVGHVAVTG